MRECGILDLKTFHKLTSLINEKSGICLGDQKHALVQARVGKRMRRLGLTDFREYFRRVEEDGTGAEVVALLDAISTNVTQFFREGRHFEVLGGLVSGWARAGRRRLRIWSAACSTGEEPYSIAITVCENLTDTSDVGILATDLSTVALRKAREGVYTQRQVDQLPRCLMLKYFVKERGEEETRYRVIPAVRDLVTFARLNLATPPFPMKGPFDVIFCRNVLIYFGAEVRRRLIQSMYDLLAHGGYAIVGHAESMAAAGSPFKLVRSSIYTKE